MVVRLRRASDFERCARAADACAEVVRRATGTRRPAGAAPFARGCGTGRGTLFALFAVFVVFVVFPRGLGRRIARRFTRRVARRLRTPRPSLLASVLNPLGTVLLTASLSPLLRSLRDRRLHLRAGRRHGEGPDVHRVGGGVRNVGALLPSSVERARRSLAYRRSIPARPDSSRMAVLKRSVGRASFSSSCLRSHIGTK